MIEAVGAPAQFFTASGPGLIQVTRDDQPERALSADPPGSSSGRLVT
jgi:hypothetical protein